MHPKKTRHPWYALLMLVATIISSSAIANGSFERLITGLTSPAPDSPARAAHAEASDSGSRTRGVAAYGVSGLEAAPFFNTIILNADQEVTCSANGFTVARFNLCGDNDDRAITVSGSHSSYEWQQLVPGGTCTFDVNDDCPPHYRWGLQPLLANRFHGFGLYPGRLGHPRFQRGGIPRTRGRGRVLLL